MIDQLLVPDHSTHGLLTHARVPKNSVKSSLALMFRSESLYVSGTQIHMDDFNNCDTPSPTRAPTAAPTFIPSQFPTKFPTQFPTKFPSKFPTQFPTNPKLITLLPTSLHCIQTTLAHYPILIVWPTFEYILCAETDMVHPMRVAFKHSHVIISIPHSNGPISRTRIYMPFAAPFHLPV